MSKVQIVRGNDPLGYDGSVPERLRAMAEDELAGINDAAVEDEVVVLRARLGLRKKKPIGDGHDQGRYDADPAGTR
jgi:hypothetical protein